MAQLGKHDERNQADNLMKLFQEVANHTPDDLEQHEVDTEQESENRTEEAYVELDILNLPPRREVHGERKNRYSFTLSKPITRFVFVIILVVAVVAALLYFDLINEPFSFF